MCEVILCLIHFLINYYSVGMPFTRKKSIRSDCFWCSKNCNSLKLPYHHCGKGRNAHQLCFQINNSHADNIMLVHIYSLLEKKRYDFNSINNVLPNHIHKNLMTFIGKDKITLCNSICFSIKTRTNHLYQIDNSRNIVI